MRAGWLETGIGESLCRTRCVCSGCGSVRALCAWGSLGLAHFAFLMGAALSRCAQRAAVAAMALLRALCA